LWKYGNSDLVRTSGLEKTLLEDDRRDGVSAPPDELAADLEKMGPIYIKLGQVLSTRPDILPAEYVKALGKLQNELEPFSFEEVRRIVEEELHLSVEDIYSSFDPVPIASASLGQVHWARLKDGREVAVKVQRPNIKEEIVSDLTVLDDIANMLEEYTEFGPKYQVKGALEQFRQNLARELDYRQEAGHMRELGKNLEAFPHIIIPQPVEQLTTSRVLTMSFIHGKKITSLGVLALNEIDGASLADELFQAYLKQILVDGFFHADPHPGNVFIVKESASSPNASVALIDIGMVGRLSPRLQEELLKLLLAMSEMRSDEAADIALKIGERDMKDRDNFSENVFRHKIAQLFEMQFTSSLDQMQTGALVMEFTRVCATNGLRMPPEFTMLGKTLLNLDEIGRTLDPQFKPNDALRRHATKITRDRVLKSLNPSTMLTAAMEAKEFAQEMPGRVNRILDSLARNELSFRVQAFEEKTLIAGFQKIANRITTGLVLAALIIGAALLMRVETSFTLFGYPGLAILCFLGAAIGAGWLLLEIAVHDRK
jgi:predicted unusual protein kinase regulating ubiquinone biosynthesis (AarF/ABC1/UbiB family)